MRARAREGEGEREIGRERKREKTNPSDFVFTAPAGDWNNPQVLPDKRQIMLFVPLCVCVSGR